MAEITIYSDTRLPDGRLLRVKAGYPAEILADPAYLKDLVNNQQPMHGLPPLAVVELERLAPVDYPNEYRVKPL